MVSIREMCPQSSSEVILELQTVPVLRARDVDEAGEIQAETADKKMYLRTTIGWQGRRNFSWTLRPRG